MKSLLIPYCTLLSFVALAQQAPSKSQQEVQHTIITVFEALSNRDSVSLRNNCTTDVRFYEYGESWTIDTLIHRAIIKNTATDFKRTNKFEFINTTIKGDVAWATYNLTSTITSNGNERVVNWNETVILLRERKQWKLAVLQSTRVGK
ncbi:MAG TPA: hypothetical protein DHV26_06870 [Cytophagales bacterium]|nr:hypothetical protein [Cytophagales bacterium]HRG09523.1 nuclear transport factor 2 family protein [Cyclobacteriaceae bacterium]